MARTFVCGVGMTQFVRPLTKSWDYPDMGSQAGNLGGANSLAYFFFKANLSS